MIPLGVLVLSCSGQISSGSVLGSCLLFRGLICITRSTISYAVVHFALGWIGGYLVGSDIFGLFGRFFRALGWFKCIIACTMAYTVIDFALGWIGGYLVGPDILELFVRLFRALGWFNRSYVFCDTICGAAL